jgi:hypothetical protein
MIPITPRLRALFSAFKHFTAQNAKKCREGRRDFRLVDFRI